MCVRQISLSLFDKNNFGDYEQITFIKNCLDFYCYIKFFENKKKTPKVAEVLPWAPNLAPARHKLGRHGLVLSCTLK